MDRRFELRLDELLADAELQPAMLWGLVPRLERFLEPFSAHLDIKAQRDNARDYVAGLLSPVERKNVESIAYLHDRERQGMQKFIGQAPWDHQPLFRELARQVGMALGEADGFILAEFVCNG
jgi:SRSO17 transposase